MKRPKRLTRKYKEVCTAYNLNPSEWMLVKETGFYIHIINKVSKKRRILDKFIRKAAIR